MAEDLEYVPSEEAEKVVAMVKAWVKNAQRAKAKRKEITDKCYKVYRGEFYTPHQKKQKKKANSQRNYIFSSVEDGLALLTDNQPSLDCWPRAGPDDLVAAEKAKRVLSFVWERSRMDQKLPMALRDHLISGVGILKVYYDPLINYPDGEIVVDVVHPDHLLVDPDATSLETAKVVIQHTPTPLWKIVRDYPEKGKFVKPNESISLEEDGTTLSSEYNKEVDSAAPSDAKHYRAWLDEVWVRDEASFTEEETNEETGEAVTVTRLKYPNGRKIVVAGDVWLNEEDDNNPFEDGDPPYIIIPNYEQSDSFWPMGDVEHITEINTDINKIVSRLNDYIRMTAHTHIVYDDEANIDEASLDNLEGALIKKSKGGEVNITPPPNFPSAVFEWLFACKSDLEIISGIREVLQGRSPGSGESGVAFERLQEFALSRIRKKARNVNNALILLGEKLLSRIRQYYTDPRKIRITGDVPQLLGVEMINRGNNSFGFMDFTNQDLYRTDEMGQMTEEIPLDVVLEVGTAATVTRNRDRQDALLLFDKGIIDDEEVARRFDIRNYPLIKARIEQKMLQQAQMQMQAQMGASGGVPPGGGGPVGM